MYWQKKRINIPKFLVYYTIIDTISEEGEKATVMEILRKANEVPRDYLNSATSCRSPIDQWRHPEPSD